MISYTRVRRAGFQQRNWLTYTDFMISNGRMSQLN